MAVDISPLGLQPGQWVVFSHATEQVSEQLRGPFKVINRDDAMFDGCRCFLMNFAGQILDYCPRMGELDYKRLPWNYTVRVIDKEAIARQLEDHFGDVQLMAIGHLNRLAQSEYFGRGFNPTDNS